MKLYIKQKVFSWADRFTVKDSSGNDRYFVEGELFSWGTFEGRKNYYRANQKGICQGQGWVSRRR